ncbi:hypothetical protein RB595_005080 [Gaeumannomyces hyphopodioides]
MHFAVLPFCVLCRTTLPSASDYSTEGDDAGYWEFSVVCLINLADNVERDPLQVHMLTANLAEDSFLHCGRNLTLRRKRGADGGVQHRIHRPADLPPSGDIYDLSRPMFFAHRDCWKLVRGQHRGLTATQLYRFAQATQPLAAAQLYRPAQATQPIPRLPALGSGCESRLATRLLPPDLETRPDTIFSQCHRLLPPELVGEVVRHLVGGGRSLAASLAVATQTSSTLLGLVPPDPTPSVTAVNLLSQTSLIPSNGWIRASTIRLFGHNYLRRLEFVPDGDHDASGEHDHADPGVHVQPDLIDSVRFVLGMHGLRAVRFILQDGSSTPWLGEPGTDGCHGRVVGSGLGRFQVLQDDFKVVRVDYLPCMDAHGQRDLTPPAKALWDVNPDSVNLGLAKKRIVDMSAYPAQILHYPGWRLCRYLPLIGHHGNEAGDSTGLTLHCHSCGIAAITVHYKKGESYTVGNKEGGLPLYFNLGPRERVDFVAVCAIEETFQGPYFMVNDCHQFGPYLMVGTNRGRSAFFGPCYHRYHSMAKWTVAASGPVDGLIVDALVTRGSAWLQNLGAATAPRISPPASLRRSPPALPAFWGRPRDCFPFTSTSSFFTSARVFSPHGVQRLRTRRAGGRYTGLCLHHADGTVESLGQWDGSVEDGDCGKDGPLSANADDTAAAAAAVVVTDILNDAEAPRVVRWIAFHYASPPCSANQKGISHVVDIEVGFGEDDLPAASATNDDRKRIWQASGLESELLAWWCTRTYDYVEPWNGAMAVHRMPARRRVPVVLCDIEPEELVADAAYTAAQG